MISKKIVVREGKDYSIDLTKAGYGKLLGCGLIKNKYKITVGEASKKAVEKVKEKGGQVILPSTGDKDQ